MLAESLRKFESLRKSYHLLRIMSNRKEVAGIHKFESFVWC